MNKPYGYGYLTLRPTFTSCPTALSPPRELFTIAIQNGDAYYKSSALFRLFYAIYRGLRVISIGTFTYLLALPLHEHLPSNHDTRPLTSSEAVQDLDLEGDGGVYVEVELESAMPEVSEPKRWLK